MNARLMELLKLAGRIGAVIVSLLALWHYWIAVKTIIPGFISELSIIGAAGAVFLCWIVLVLLAIGALRTRTYGWGTFLLAMSLVLAVVSLNVPSLAHRLLLHRNRQFIAWARESLPMGQPVLVRTGDRGLAIPYRWHEHLFATKLDDGRPVLGTPIFDGTFVVALDKNRAVLEDPWEWRSILRAGVLRSIVDQHAGTAETLLLQGEEGHRVILEMSEHRLIPASPPACVAIRRGSSVYFVIPADERSCVVAIHGEAQVELFESGYWIADGWSGWHGPLDKALEALGLPDAKKILQKTGTFY